MSKIQNELLSEHENPPTKSKEMFTPRYISNVRKEYLESQSFGRRYDEMNSRITNPFDR